MIIDWLARILEKKKNTSTLNNGNLEKILTAKKKNFTCAMQNSVCDQMSENHTCNGNCTVIAWQLPTKVTTVINFRTVPLCKCVHLPSKACSKVLPQSFVVHTVMCNTKHHHHTTRTTDDPTPTTRPSISSTLMTNFLPPLRLQKMT